ncbi:MAG: class I SAM-dependent methyltransferase [Bacteroidetes bacterium]|nr:class I SAM-dependent methyltransferase [Bacteroidota bacterium]
MNPENKTKQAVAVFNKYAENYQERFMDTTLYWDTFNVFCENIKPEAAEILEVACGPGNITKHILDSHPDYKITGTDLAPNMIELAKKNNPTANFQLMDGRAIKSLNKKYDGIISGFFFPYLSKEDTIQFIADASTILNPNGVLYISTMEEDYSKSGLQKGSKGDEIYMHYHQADYLTDALTKNNFKIIEIQRKESFSTTGTKTVDLIIISKKSSE